MNSKKNSCRGNYMRKYGTYKGDPESASLVFQTKLKSLNVKILKQDLFHKKHFEIFLKLDSASGAVDSGICQEDFTFIQMTLAIHTVKALKPFFFY